MQQMPTITEILHKIAALQSGGNPQYAEGLFPCRRSYACDWIGRADNNIFYTAIIVFTLQRLVYYFDEEQQNLFLRIREKAVQNYPAYQNQKGKKTYNFWAKNPSQHFPHGYLCSRIKSFELPDDADDTVLIYLTQAHSPEDVFWLKDELAHYSTLKPGQFKNFPAKYQAYSAYATFFSTAKMPIDHSLCVLCNILYFVYAHHLPHNAWDEGSLDLIVEAVRSEDYLKNPVALAVHYPSAPVFLYHLTRLMADFDIPKLETLLPQLKKNLSDLYVKEKKGMNRLVLAISMLRLGMDIDEVLLPNPKELKKYAFFMFSKWSYSASEKLRNWASIPFFQVNFACEAYNLTLILEYVQLKKLKEK
ncbi:MAG: hypothetical protein NW226_09690 [Microscillaceae bacterium]|nr:hypothetical protein [Microscillaceae bacterium]